MSRGKKSRTMKGKLNIKTGSKKDFIKEGELGKIPSKNRLAKHKKRQKSVYHRFLEENNQIDTTSGHQSVRERLKKHEEKEVAADIKVSKKEKPSKDFNELSGDELLDMFN